jgi:hypothetical protein
MADQYILQGHKPIPANNLKEWGEWVATADRKVALDVVNEAKISTVFLSLNHAFTDNDPPLLFETMVFGGEFDQETERYSTWEEAEIGHIKMVDKVQGR